MKSLPKIILIAYVLALLWLLLFKTSLDFAAILTGHQMRSLNLVPFTGHGSEMIENFAVFVPLGLLIGIHFKKIKFWQKFVAVFIFSLAVEAVQYVLAIGVSDITDILMNTLGGLLGLAAYSGIKKKSIAPEKWDRSIAITITLLLLACLVLRFFVFRVRY